MTVTTLAYTGAVQTYIVPAGVTSVTIECWGAAGANNSNGGAGGKGGYAKGALIAAPGTVLSVYVGGTTTTGAGGWNGGGAGGGGTSVGAGGGTDVRFGGTALANRVIVAGGGGGGTGVNSPGGDGGGTRGTAPFGGQGGQENFGYARGIGAPGTLNGWGGCGGGYWGGSAGGGGGSGYVDSSLVNSSMQNGVRAGAGQVVITALNTAPLAATLTAPDNNGYIIVGEANPFTWTFNDPDAGDTQSSAAFRYKKTGDPGWTTLNNVATTAGSYTLPANSWTTGFQYEWQIQSVDKNGLSSPWSASRFTNTIATVPAPTITNPAAGINQLFTPVSLEWTLPVPFTQSAYQVQRANTSDGAGIIYYSSGTVTSSAQSASVPLDPVSGRTDWLRVRFYYLGHWSLWASVNIVPQLGQPQNPLLVLSQRPGLPVVDIQITNPPAYLGLVDTLITDLYRDGIRIAANLPNNSTFTDWLPGATASYLAIAYSASGGSATSI